MSRGLGKYQRMIMEKLQDCEGFYLIDSLPSTYKLREYQALHRAAFSLDKARRLSIVAWLCGRKRIWIMKFGHNKPGERPAHWRNEHRCVDVKAYPGHKRLPKGADVKALPIPKELANGPFADVVAQIIEGECKVKV